MALCNGNGGVDVARHKRSAQQGGDQRAVLLITKDKLCRHAHNALALAGQLVRPPLLHGRQRQKSGSAGVFALEQQNGALGLLLGVDHNVLHGRAQRRLNGKRGLLLRSDQRGERAVHAWQPAVLRLLEHELDGA